MKDEKMCPMTEKYCTVDCAWFRDGECCITSLPVLVEKVEHVVMSIGVLGNVIVNKDFTK